MLLPGAGQRADLPGQSESFTAQLSWQQRVPAGPGHSEGQRGRPAVDAASPAQSSSRRAPRAGEGEGASSYLVGLAFQFIRWKSRGFQRRD